MPASRMRQKIASTVIGVAAAGSMLATSGCGSLVPISSLAPCTTPGPLSQTDSFTTSLSLVTTSTGLRYADIRVGCGAAPRSGQLVTLQYTAWFTSGQKFDTSRVSGHQPLTFRVGGGQIIPGLDQGVNGMRVGGKRRVEIPPSLAFGSRGQSGLIPPNATLVMTLELVAVR